MEKIKAVNLGGWFVLERWMKPSLYKDYDIPKRCETSFVSFHPNPKISLEEHWKAWITEEDIRFLKEIGINLVRIPIPWWLFPDSYPSNIPYHSPLAFLDKAMDFIDKAGMKVMLDLHTAPRNQNGFDNGGIDGVMEWHLHPDAMEATLTVLEKIAGRYRNHPALYALEVLNEPNIAIDLNLIRNFYTDAYQTLRKILKKETVIVFHDAFRLESWKEFFTENRWEAVWLDTHHYQCFSDHFHQMSPKDFLQYPKAYGKILSEMNRIVPVIIGEWSLGNRIDIDSKEKAQFLKDYADCQMEVYNTLKGWIFWSYKVEDFMSDWNFRGLWERNIFRIK